MNTKVYVKRDHYHTEVPEEKGCSSVSGAFTDDQI